MKKTGEAHAARFTATAASYDDRQPEYYDRWLVDRDQSENTSL
ncbi:hypothetical protein [Halohasta litorea]|uniref:Uncharacterized protein n=1 Tax=Halohasta litorea TaxID=869891 RepID=A0ABD6DBE7_9EURY|nr:hypothetical protein [Halohasta litorea]